MSRQELDIEARLEAHALLDCLRWMEAQSRAMEALETWLRRKRQRGYALRDG